MQTKIKNLLNTLVFFSVTVVWGASVNAETFTSGERQNTLIELYTSEGCSSCPPAEKYLNSFKDNPGLWKTFIPVALHVDYWDYLGWKDRFASPLHTQRQRALGQVNLQDTIYTPGFFVNGDPWRRGFFGSEPKVSKDKAGKLSVTLDKNRISAEFLTKQFDSQPLTLTVAVLGMGLKSSIKAGENSGHKSLHEFVILKYITKKSNNARWTFELPVYDQMGASQLAVVAWVSKAGNPRPIQSVGGYIKR